MLIFPAIDLVNGKAVRLFKGDYRQMTVYNDDPTAVAKDFKDCGAKQMHIVDLEGARDGLTPNFNTIMSIKKEANLFCEVGGGIRSIDTISRYLDVGIDRVILGTAAITEPGLVEKAVSIYGAKIAVGADLKDGYVAVKGWTEKTALTADMFFVRMQDSGVSTVICTDISKDGAMAGTNHDLYAELTAKFSMNLIASGGVSSMDDVVRLRDAGMYGAIIGKAYYTGAIDLKKAVEAAQ